jgi:aromatic-L-amino-acid/L-tryptophan decarboxylase
MAENTDFKATGYHLVDWVADYFQHVEKYPIQSNLEPGDIEKKLPDKAPVKGEIYKQILDDFSTVILPGITHWQHPGFHAYFPANNSEPSVLAEILTAGLGIQGMKWVTSPSATELEKVVMKWLQQMIGLPDFFRGVIMDTASVATLCAILAARESVSSYTINENGFEGKKLRVYCSKEAHSSVEKAVRIAGFGSRNLVKIAVDEHLQMIPEQLEEAIEKDLKNQFLPTCVIGAMGTTGTGAIDPLERIAEICKRHAIWFHVDAAYAGTALMLPEFRETAKGFEMADSFVFNPHKWMFTNFDSSAFFVRNPELLTKTFSLVPAYLQSGQDTDLDFSNWGIQLGRRFRALKLWFVIRHFGVEGLQRKIREHIRLGELFERKLLEDQRFELVTDRQLNIVCFRLCDPDPERCNSKNKVFLEKINQSGKVFLSHTEIEGKFVIRFVCGQTQVEERHIHQAWDIISSCASEID